MRSLPFALIIASLIVLAGVLAVRADTRHHLHGRDGAVAHAHYSSVQRRPSQAAVEGHDARPSAWCGWEMRRLVGRDPGPSYNLASNWAHWGHPASGPAPGVIGVMAHHVFQVIAVLGRGMVLAISGNDGHAVRTRPRSTARVIAWRAI